MKDKHKARRKVGKASLFAIKWMTPYGLLKSIWESEWKNRSQILDSSNRRLIEVRAYIGIIICLSFTIGCAWLAFQSVSDTQSVGITAVLSVTVLIFSLLKLMSYISILRHEKEKNETTEDKEVVPSDFKIDSIVASVLLFRMTAFKYAYAMAACFSLTLLISPNNVNGLRLIIENGALSTSTATLSILTAVALSIILWIKSITAKNDAAIVKKQGAKPDIQGYLTVSNNSYEIVSMIILVVAVSILGDIFIEAIATSLPLSLAGTIPVIIAIYLICFSITVFRSGISISGFITDDKKTKLSPLNLLVMLKLSLPAAQPDQKLNKVPNIKLIVAISFGFCIISASLGGVLTLIVLLPVTILQGILLTIDEFKLGTKEYFGE
jgi:hypothetical protein